MAGVARRSVLRGAAAAAVLPLAAVGVAVAAPHAAVGVGRIPRRTLEAAVGSPVRIVGDGGSVKGTLHHVHDLSHASAGHPQAFTATFHLDGDAAVLEGGLADIELPSVRLTGAGLLVLGAPGDRTVVLLVDRRSVSEHPTTRP